MRSLLWFPSSKTPPRLTPRGDIHLGPALTRRPFLFPRRGHRLRAVPALKADRPSKNANRPARNAGRLWPRRVGPAFDRARDTPPPRGRLRACNAAGILWAPRGSPRAHRTPPLLRVSRYIPSLRRNRLLTGADTADVAVSGGGASIGMNHRSRWQAIWPSVNQRGLPRPISGTPPLSRRMSCEGTSGRDRALSLPTYVARGSRPVQADPLHETCVTVSSPAHR